MDREKQGEVWDTILSCARAALQSGSVAGMKALVVATAGLIRELAGAGLESRSTNLLKDTVQTCGLIVKKDRELGSDFLEKLVYLALVKSTYPKERVRDMFSKGRYSDVKKMASTYYSPKALELSRRLILKKGGDALEDMRKLFKNGKG